MTPVMAGRGFAGPTKNGFNPLAPLPSQLLPDQVKLPHPHPTPFRSIFEMFLIPPFCKEGCYSCFKGAS